MKNAYVQKADAQREMWQAKLDELKAKLKESAADARISLQAQISDLQTKIKNTN